MVGSPASFGLFMSSSISPSFTSTRASNAPRCHASKKMPFCKTKTNF